MPRGGGRRICVRRSRGGESRFPRQPVALEEDPAGPHPPRAGRRLHGRDLWPPHRQDRRLPRHIGPRCDQFRHCRRLCAAGRHADDDDHRPEADQEVEAGPLPDPRRRRHDAADHQIYPPARFVGQHPLPRPRGLPARRGGEAGRGPSRASRGHCRRAYRIAAAAAQPGPPPACRREIGPRRGEKDRGGEGAGPRHRRGREPQDDQPDAAPVRREDRHPVRHHPARQGRARRDPREVPRLRRALGRRLRPPRDRGRRPHHQCRP